MTSGTTVNNPSDFTCKFLVPTSNNKEGYYCTNACPCPNIEKASADCPLIDLARSFECKVMGFIRSGQAQKDFIREIKDVNKVV